MPFFVESIVDRPMGLIYYICEDLQSQTIIDDDPVFATWRHTGD